MINMFPCMEILQNKVVPMMANLNQRDITDTVLDGRDKAEDRTYKAEISRQLLELGDIVGLLEAMIRQEYWIMKGRGIDVEITLLEEL